ncbi:MAG: F0F1 ATP synthase subunit gamma, partial [Planctomycetota bacterium]|nr:F0F1 ATP synthase subunit gamma [Planctomycetota bacterium]
MASVRDLKVRIKAVSNICQITRAMEMVATTKLRRFQTRAEASGPYTREIEGLVQSLAGHVGGGGGHPLFTRREGKRTGLLIVTSDRGLCGAYNTNVLLKLRDWERSQPDRQFMRYVIGKKGMSWLSRRDIDVAGYFEDPPLEQSQFRDAGRLAQLFVKQVLAN